MFVQWDTRCSIYCGFSHFCCMCCSGLCPGGHSLLNLPPSCSKEVSLAIFAACADHVWCSLLRPTAQVALKRCLHGELAWFVVPPKGPALWHLTQWKEGLTCQSLSPTPHHMLPSQPGKEITHLESTLKALAHKIDHNEIRHVMSFFLCQRFPRTSIIVLLGGTPDVPLWPQALWHVHQVRSAKPWWPHHHKFDKF